MLTMEVDGMDAVAVYEAVKKAQHLIQEGHGPVFLEAMTCRYEGHSMSDPGTYRSKEEMEICKARDPIERMEKVLKERYHLETEQIEAMQQRAQKAADDAVSFAADAAEPELSELYEHIFDKGGLDAVS